MEKLPNQTDSQDLMHIRHTIQSMEMPVDSFSNKIMNRLEEKNRRSSKTKRMKKTLVAASTAAALGAGIIGSGFVSPAMAESLGNIPLVSNVFKLAGDLGLRTAHEKGLITEGNQSDTQDGITISVPQVMYDGTRVSMAIHRKAPGLTSYLNGSHVNTDGEVISEPEGTKGTIRRVDLFMNGKPLTHLSESLARQINVGWGPGVDKDSAILRFSDLSNQGLGDSAFPDQFDLTMKLTLEGVNDPFTINVPVKKSINNNIVLSSSMTKEFDHIRVTLEKAELSPSTTRVSIIEDGTSNEIPKRYKDDKTTILQLGYDVFDDHGTRLELLGGQGNDEGSKRYTYKDYTYEPFKVTPKSFTIKPFLHVYKDKNENHGEFLLDSNGEPVKEYIKELEMAIPVTE